MLAPDFYAFVRTSGHLTSTKAAVPRDVGREGETPCARDQDW